MGRLNESYGLKDWDGVTRIEGSVVLSPVGRVGLTSFIVSGVSTTLLSRDPATKDVSLGTY